MHWTEAPNPPASLLRVDGKTWRIMGNEPRTSPRSRKPVLILPTTVTYTFEGAGVQVTLSFMTPVAAGRPADSFPPRPPIG